MGVRENADLDIVITDRLRRDMFNGQASAIDLGDISIIGKDSNKYKIFGCEGDDDLVRDYSITLNGYNFCEPRF